MQLHNIPDHRKIDLSNATHQAALRYMFDGWICEGLGAQRNHNIINTWDRCSLYYEGYQAPIGFTNNYLHEFVSANATKLNLANILQKDERGKYFVIDNKIPKVLDAILGEYTSVRQTIQVVKDDYPKNNTIEKAIQRLFDKTEHDYNIWHSVTIPAIEMMSMWGLGWVKSYFDPGRNKYRGGNIDIKAIAPHEVLFDPTCKKKYFRDSRFRIHRNIMNLAEARKFVEGFGKNPANLNSESPFAEGFSYLDQQRYSNARDVNREYAIIYCIEYVITYRMTNKKDMRLESTGEYIPDEADEEDKDFYFYALYNQSPNIGTFYHAINKNTYSVQDYDKFYLTPFTNKQSNVRPFPRSDIEDLTNKQDLINICKTLILNSAKEHNTLRMAIDEKIYDEMGRKYGKNGAAILDDFWDFGGWLPIPRESGQPQDVNKMITVVRQQELPKEVYEFLVIAERDFDSQANTDTPLSGDYPKSGDLNYKAQLNLQRQKRRQLTYKDININYAMVTIAKKLYNIFANEYTDERMIRLLNANPGDPQTMIINGIMSAAEYEQHLINLGLVDKETAETLISIPSNDPNFIEKKEILLESASKKYSEENEVEIFFAPHTSDGQPLTNAYSIYINGLVFVNMLSKNDEVDIVIKLDFNAERDEQEQKALGLQLFQSGNLAIEDLFELLGGYFSDNRQRLLDNLKKNKDTLMLAKEIESRGEDFVKLIMGAITQYDMANKQQMLNQKNPKQLPMEMVA